MQAFRHPYRAGTVPGFLLSPFFPTRLPIAGKLQTDLLDEREAPIVFLTGEPGSGKTSVVSWLANRRTDHAFQGIIGIRFFCFEPIRPEHPFISPDASRVKPKELWFSLLTQLRRGLATRLFHPIARGLSLVSCRALSS